MTPIDENQPSDEELLFRYVAGRDQRAFTELVKRHGAMVMGVAMRLLGNPNDADDAFQATFLALAKAAGKIKHNEATAAWLHTTATRAARSIQRMNSRWKRNIGEKAKTTREACQAAPLVELREVLDVELGRLPENLRAAVVLCDLEGLSRTRAAEQLGLSTSTLANHVADGRKLLRSRVARRGIRTSIAGLTAHMAKLPEACPALSPTLVRETATKATLFAAGRATSEIGVSKTVVDVTQEVLKAMTLLKLIVIGVTALAMGLGVSIIDGVSQSLSSVATANTILFDDFDDRNAEDATPVTWTPFDGFPGTYDASTGDYILRPSSNSANAAVSGILNPPLKLRDVSIRAQVRADSINEGLGLLARTDATGLSAYQGGIFSNGFLYIVRNDPAPTILSSTATDLRPIDEDVVLQFDAIGDELSLYAWRATESRPAEPQLRASGGMLQEGTIGVLYDPGAPGRGSATFRNVHVADASIPEPSTAIVSTFSFVGFFIWQQRRSHC